MIRYPHIKAKLTGANGNIFNLMAIVANALRRGHVAQSEIDLFYEEATKDGNEYDDAIQVCMAWVDVE